MWSSRLFWKILLAYGAIFIVFAVMYVLIVAPQQQEVLAEQIRNRLQNDAALVYAQIEKPLAAGRYDEIQNLVSELGRKTQLRVSVIAADGTVVADSEENPKRMRDHGSRPELIAARKYGWGETIRQSSTMSQQMHYFALAIRERGKLLGFVRVAVSLDSVYRDINRLNRTVLLLALGVGALAIPMTFVIARRIVSPLARMNALAKGIAGGDFSQSLPDTGKDELGQLATMLGNMQERLKHRFNELQENSDRMLAVLSGMAEGVIAVDPNQRLLLANAPSLSLLEVATKDVVGRPLLEAVRNRDVQQTVLDALQDNKPSTREITLKTGSRRVLRLLAAPLPGSPCPGVIVVMHDVTELKRLESLRRDFVANVSHELKTPLAAIKAYAETLRLGAMNDPENSLKFVERIEEQANRLHQLILDLLHLARVETGKEAFDFEEVSLVQAVENCIEQFADRALNSSVTLASQPDCEDLYVWADQGGVRTILDNLVSNAITYTPGGGRVTLRWRRDGSHAAIEIQDTGIGIAPRDQLRVFERFYRADRARSRELGGTGLGLAIVKHLVQAFGGDVGLESQVGGGSTFRIRLPLAPRQTK